MKSRNGLCEILIERAFNLRCVWLQHNIMQHKLFLITKETSLNLS